MSIKKLAFGVCGAVILLIGGGVIAVYSFVDRQMIIKQLSETIEKQTGQKLSINKVNIQFFPWPKVSAVDIGLSNLSNTQHPYILKANKLEASINILPLWNYNIRFNNFHLSNVQIYLERDLSGQFNWRNNKIISDHTVSIDTKDQKTLPRLKWKVEFSNIALDNVECWYIDQFNHHNIQIHFDSAELNQIEDNKLRFNFIGRKHQTKFLVSGRINSSVEDITTNLFTNIQNILSQPFKLQLNLAEYVHEQKIGNIRISGNIKNPLKLRGYDLTIRGTILNLSDINRFFPHAHLPSVQNITLNTAIEDSALETEDKAKPKIKLLQLHTDTIKTLPFAPNVHIEKTQIIANQLNEKIDTKIDGKIGDNDFHWIGEIGTLNSFYDILFNKSSKPIRVKGVFNSSNMSADLDGNIGGVSPSLYAKINIISFEYLFHHIGNIVARDVFFKGTINLPFIIQDDCWADFSDKILTNLRVKGKLNTNAIKLNQFNFQKADTDLEWNKSILKLNSLKLVDKGNVVQGFVEYVQQSNNSSLLLKIDHSIVPMAWLDDLLDLPKLYSGDVEIVSNLYSKGDTKQAILRNLDGHFGISGVNGKIDVNGLRHFIGNSLPNISAKPTLIAQCLVVHANISKNNIIFDTLTMQTKQFALNGQGTINTLKDTIDLQLLPDVNLGSVNASMPIRISGSLSRPHAFIGMNKNNVYTLNINSVNKTIAPKNYCVGALFKAREYSDNFK